MAGTWDELGRRKNRRWGGGAPGGKVLLCARESALSVSMLRNSVVSLRLRRSTDVRVRWRARSDVQICGFSSLAVAAERRAGGR